MVPALLLLDAPLAPPYELEAVSVERAGHTRPYYETSYTYSHLRPDGSKQVLWHETVGEKYGYHWVSPSGRFWIVSDRVAGPGGGSALSARERNGELVRRFYLDFGSVMPKGNSPLAFWASQPANVYHLEASSAAVLRSELAELLVLQTRTGSKRQVLLMREAPSTKWQVFQNEDDRSLLVRLAADPSWTLPKESWPFGEKIGAPLWTSSRKGERRYWLQREREINGIRLIKGSESLDGPPPWTFVKPTFAIISLEQAGARPALVIRSLFDGEALGRVDLRKVGGYSTAREAASDLKLDELSFSDVGWRPASQLESRPIDVPTAFDVFDRQGRRLEFTVQLNPPLVRGRILTGLAARRPKDLRYPAVKVREERNFYSEDKRFRLRIRTSGYGSNERNYITFITRVKEGAREVDVELWAGVASMPAHVFISRTGRTYLFSFHAGDVYATDPKTGETRPEYQERATLSILDVDGKMIAGMVMDQHTDIKSNAEAERKIDYRNLRVSYAGEYKTRTVEGIQVPYYSVEKFMLPVRGGKDLAHEITKNPGSATDWVIFRN